MVVRTVCGSKAGIRDDKRQRRPDQQIVEPLHPERMAMDRLMLQRGVQRDGHPRQDHTQRQWQQPERGPPDGITAKDQDQGGPCDAGKSVCFHTTTLRWAKSCVNVVTSSQKSVNVI